MKHHLKNGEIDFCISSVPIEDPEIVWEPLMTEEIFLIVPLDTGWQDGTISISMK